MLVSDLDATLIASDYTIPVRNLKAIERFQERGGLFAVASGRITLTARRFLNLLNPNAPCLLVNGAIVYDHREGQILSQQCLPEESRAAVAAIMKRFDAVGVEAFCGDTLYVLRDHTRVQEQMQKDSLQVVYAQLEDIPVETCHKFLFSGAADEIRALKDFTTGTTHDTITFVNSSSFYLELLRTGVNKGTGLVRLMEMLGIERQNTFAIGDHDNDAEMIAAAGTGACPYNATKEIRKKADMVVGHCDNGAVADFIEYIEKTFRVTRKGT